MSPERCQAIFFTASVIIGIAIGIIGGLPGWGIGTVLMFGGPAMYAYGCHRAAEKAKRTGARVALLKIKSKALADIATKSPSEAHQQPQ